MDKEDPVRKQLKSNALVAMKTMSIAELSDSKYQHYIHKDGRGDFYIIRCDVCGMHFRKNMTGAMNHLSKGPQHHSLRKDEGLDNGVNREGVFRFMGIKVLDCSDEAMERHNDALERLGSRHPVRNMLSNYPRERDGCYHPEHPVVLLPRNQEKNRPRWHDRIGGTRDVSSSAETIPSGSADTRAGLLVQSDLPRPQSTQRVHGFVPGQIYWTRENAFAKYRPVLALPYNDLKEIGLPGWEVSRWIDWMRVRYTYDATTGYFHDDRLHSRNIREPEKVYPLLYLDDCNGDTDPKVTYGLVSMVREFDRDEITEGDPTYERLFQYLDQETLWFVGDQTPPPTSQSTRAPCTHERWLTQLDGESSPSSDRPITPQPVSDSRPIEIPDDDDSELPTISAIADKTPPKPRASESRAASKGKGRDVRDRTSNTSRPSTWAFGDSPASERDDPGPENGESSGLAPVAVMSC
jgi:hypothetical protein